MRSILGGPFDLAKVVRVNAKQVDLESVLVLVLDPIGKVNARRRVDPLDNVSRNANCSDLAPRSELANAVLQVGVILSLSDCHELVVSKESIVPSHESRGTGVGLNVAANDIG